MNVLPVAHRELRVLARRPGTYRFRCLSALVVMLVCMAMLYVGFGGRISAASAGRELFVILSSLAAVYVLLDGALMTADCLSREKREGTLGLLFLTDLRGYDIVAGKLISRTGNSAYGLLAALPMLGIPLFLGGVTGREFASMMAALLNGLFFSASLGMLISAVCRREKQSLMLAVAGVAAIAGVLPAIGCWQSWVNGSLAIHPVFLIASPAGAFLNALNSGPGPLSLGYSFGQSLLVAHAVGWCFLAAACVILPHTWSERVAAPVSRARSRQKSRKLEAGLSLRRERTLEDGGLIWAAGPPRRHGSNWVLLLLLICGWTIALSSIRSGRLTLLVYAGMVALLHASLIAYALLQACRSPAQDERNGTLETLLTTPLGEHYYLRGRLLSIKRSCVWPLLFVMGTDAGLMAAGCLETGAMSWEWLPWIGVCLTLGVKLLLDLYALAWVGFWQGLKTGHTARAIRRTVLYVFLMKWLVVFLFVALIGILTRGQVFDSAAGIAVTAGPYILGFLAASLHYCGTAMSQVRDDLRGLVNGAGEFAPRSPKARSSAQPMRRMRAVPA